MTVSDVAGGIPKRCSRCGKRLPTNPDWSRNWNIQWVVGYATGYLCPNCQTVEEDLEAQVAEIDEPFHVTTEPQTIAEAMLKSYRTPELMRAKAYELEAARPDCAEPVRLMRELADDMEDERKAHP